MPAERTPAPRFSTLDAPACRSVLDRNHVGRLAFLNRGAVDIEPVHYASDDGWLFVRSANGTKLEALARTPYVAFEVDEIKSVTEWRSVVARGTIYLMSASGSPLEQRTLAKALRALRSVIPEAMTDDDPMPFLKYVYGVHIDTLTGRQSEMDDRPATRPIVHEPERSTHPTQIRDGF